MTTLATSRRSPNYPSIDLGSAIDAMRIVFLKQGRHAMARDKLAQHLGYSSLSGRAHEKIAALRAYGLVEGGRNEMRVSEDTITLLVASKGTAERRSALSRRAFHSAIFRTIVALQNNDEHINETDLRAWLKKRSFTPGAVERLVISYFATMKLVADESGGYHLLKGSAGGPAGTAVELSEAALPGVPPGLAPPGLAPPGLAPSPAGSRREVIALAEGDVTITFPETLTIESYEDLAASLQLFLRKARRRAVPRKQV